jgi:primosomal protein N' (replication factor Y)
MTYYQENQSVRCHHCGLSQADPTTCPNCRGLQISFSGFGTERVEAELSRLFPQARAGRLDRELLQRKAGHACGH